MKNTVIIYTTPVPECWGNLKFFCKAKGLKYSTISKLKLPIKHEGYEVHRVINNRGNT